MTIERLIFAASTAADKATKIAQAMWGKQTLSHAQTVELLSAARSLSCAAQQLDSLAAGNPPPKHSRD